MLTQIIEGSIMTPKLDDIVMRTGETNRIIIFRLLDGKGEAITSEDYSMEFIMQKPDGNFVIQTLGSITDGFYLHTVEQMATAGGVGYYTLRITDNDDLIYTAHGSVIVDDNTLSDGDIESISEVNGLRFPDDFLTTDSPVAMLDDTDTSTETTWSSNKITDEISGLIDDNATSTERTWSSDKIDNELNNIQIGYSTTERKIGTWIDGSELYEIVFKINALSSGFQSLTHNLPLGDMYWIECGFAEYIISDNRYTSTVMPYSSSVGVEEFRCALNKTAINYRAGSDIINNSGSVKLVIRYTK